MLNVDKGDVHVDNRRRKLEQLSVQQILNTRLMSVSLLTYVRRLKFTFRDQNAELEKLAFLRPPLSDATFSNARSVPLLRGTRPASLQQNAGLIKSMFPKCH